MGVVLFLGFILGGLYLGVVSVARWSADKTLDGVAKVASEVQSRLERPAKERF
jgi:hypothetical protein